jgi:uncharacterized membrane protein YfhO
MMYGIRSAGGYDIVLDRLKKFTSDITLQDMSSVNFTTRAVLAPGDRRMDMLNSKYVVVSKWDARQEEFRNHPERFRLIFQSTDTDVYENRMALPPAFFVPASGIEVLADEAQQLARVKDPTFDPLRNVVLEKSPASADGAAVNSTDVAASTVEWIERKTNGFELRVAASQPGVLVVSQTYYPGWKAWVDDVPVAVNPANYALSSVYVPDGTRTVRFAFEPWSFTLGLLITAMAAATILVFCLRFRAG